MMINMDFILNIRKLGLENFLVPLSIKLSFNLDNKDVYNVIEKNIIISTFSKTINSYILNIEGGIIDTSYSKDKNTNTIFLDMLKNNLKDKTIIKHSKFITVTIGDLTDRENYLDGVSRCTQEINIYD